MEERLKDLALGAVRLVLVGLALVLALGSVGRSALKTFCPQGAEVASVGVTVAAGRQMTLATVVEDDASISPSEEPGVPGDGASSPPTETPSTPAPAESPGEGSCAGGVRACAPPLLSSVLRYGSDDCAAQAPAELRGRLVPPLLGAMIMLGGAWALRPRHGEPVLSRE